ncbi:hypothetical protein M422DRAFT_187695 [Sphaerobolus stellatus SS14]|uniref:Unplaced genomic scaffold SPHSTscaffold_196, whole genome shotgun sequence n=1 Tax=Sphaerobolus stellatus (strain SS14) TaxID=990650 RepID=A0A0C9UXA7_SPHS4|nr:hypothetical protein M422DRAFT_187695 [Sphaerobolus stellatus SS14]
MGSPTVLDLTLGSLLLGTFISTLLYGIILLQFYTYCRAQSKDPLWTKLLFLMIIPRIVETTHTFATWAMIYQLTVNHYGDPTAIVKDTPSLEISFPLAAAVGSMVQSFFAYRILKLSRSYIIPVLAWVGAIARFGFGVTLAIIPQRSPTILVFITQNLWVALTPMSINVAVDILNTVTLTYYLAKGRSIPQAAQFKS